MSASQDFTFFSQSPLDMVGETHAVRADPAGASALDCWIAFDTHGKTLPCREPDLLAKALRAKASWNLQVKLWAADVADGLLLAQPELVDYCHGLPSWVFKAVMRQAASVATRSVGFAPRFARLETVHGNWWPPALDAFDPSI